MLPTDSTFPAKLNWILRQQLEEHFFSTAKDK